MFGDVRRGERELGHSLGGDAVLHDGRDQLALLIAQNHDVTDEVRAGFSAPGIRAWQKLQLLRKICWPRAPAREGREDAPDSPEHAREPAPETAEHT